MSFGATGSKHLLRQSRWLRQGATSSRFVRSRASVRSPVPLLAPPWVSYGTRQGHGFASSAMPSCDQMILFGGRAKAQMTVMKSFSYPATGCCRDPLPCQAGSTQVVVEGFSSARNPKLMVGFVHPVLQNQHLQLFRALNQHRAEAAASELVASVGLVRWDQCRTIR